jgi:hypothetical protein
MLLLVESCASTVKEDKEHGQAKGEEKQAIMKMNRGMGVLNYRSSSDIII